MTKPKLEQGVDYERGFIDGMQHQIDKAVRATHKVMAELQSELDDAELEKIMLEVWQPVPPESDYERGFIDGMQKQMQSSVDRAVNAMTQPTYYIPSKDQHTWVGLTDDERQDIALEVPIDAVSITEAKLKQKNT